MEGALRSAWSLHGGVTVAAATLLKDLSKSNSGNVGVCLGFMFSLPSNCVRLAPGDIEM